jgi:hypothetical protein
VERYASAPCPWAFQSHPAAASSSGVTGERNSGFAWGRQQIGNRTNLDQ